MEAAPEIPFISLRPEARQRLRGLKAQLERRGDGHPGLVSALIEWPRPRLPSTPKSFPIPYDPGRLRLAGRFVLASSVMLDFQKTKDRWHVLTSAPISMDEPGAAGPLTDPRTGADDDLVGPRADRRESIFVVMRELQTLLPRDPLLGMSTLSDEGAHQWCLTLHRHLPPDRRFWWWGDTPGEMQWSSDSAVPSGASCSIFNDVVLSSIRLIDSILEPLAPEPEPAAPRPPDEPKSELARLLDNVEISVIRPLGRLDRGDGRKRRSEEAAGAAPSGSVSPLTLGLTDDGKCLRLGEHTLSYRKPDATRRISPTCAEGRLLRSLALPGRLRAAVRADAATHLRDALDGVPGQPVRLSGSGKHLHLSTKVSTSEKLRTLWSRQR